MLGFMIFKVVLFPDLFPGFAFDTPFLVHLLHGVPKIMGLQ